MVCIRLHGCHTVCTHLSTPPLTRTSHHLLVHTPAPVTAVCGLRSWFAAPLRLHTVHCNFISLQFTPPTWIVRFSPATSSLAVHCLYGLRCGCVTVTHVSFWLVRFVHFFFFFTPFLSAVGLHFTSLACAVTPHFVLRHAGSHTSAFTFILARLHSQRSLWCHWFAFGTHAAAFTCAVLLTARLRFARSFDSRGLVHVTRCTLFCARLLALRFTVLVTLTLSLPPHQFTRHVHFWFGSPRWLLPTLTYAFVATPLPRGFFPVTPTAVSLFLAVQRLRLRLVLYHRYHTLLLHTPHVYALAWVRTVPHTHFGRSNTDTFSRSLIVYKGLVWIVRAVHGLFTFALDSGFFSRTAHTTHGAGLHGFGSHQFYGSTRFTTGSLARCLCGSTLQPRLNTPVPTHTDALSRTAYVVAVTAVLPLVHVTRLPFTAPPHTVTGCHTHARLRALHALISLPHHHVRFSLLPLSLRGYLWFSLQFLTFCRLVYTLHSLYNVHLSAVGSSRTLPLGSFAGLVFNPLVYERFAHGCSYSPSFCGFIFGSHLHRFAPPLFASLHCGFLVCTRFARWFSFFSFHAPLVHSFCGLHIVACAGSFTHGLHGSHARFRLRYGWFV